MTDRYDTSGNPEGKFEPGSNNRVLLNKVNITATTEMDDLELGLLEQLTEAVLDEIVVDKTIRSEDLCDWHRRWMGNIYEWAGQYRSVNMGKDGFHFAAANLIPKLMQEFSGKFLATYTPCEGMDENQLIEALA